MIMPFELFQEGERTMTLTEAWTLWLQGNHMPDAALLWGIKFLWWARIGKALQCIAGLTIVAEIIGPERIRAFGKSFNPKITVWQFFEFLVLLVRAIAELVWFALGAIRRVALYTIIVAVLAFLGWRFEVPVLSAVERLALTTGMIVGLIALPTILTILGVLLGGSLLDVFVLSPVALILEHPALDRIVKIVALLLLIIGFHFDFLTS